MTLCVYALTGARPLRSAPRGIAGERLGLVTAGPLAAIVGRLGRTPRATIETLARYDAVMRRLEAQRPALLPARFATCFSSLDELTVVLDSRQRSLLAALAEVRYRTQMTVRVLLPGNRDSGLGTRDSEVRTPAPRILDPGSRMPGQGSAYLRERAAEAARARHIPGFDSVQDAVRRWVRAERVEKQAGVASVYHLVPRASAGAYRRAAERAASAAGLRIIVSGPWPPYAFAAW